MENHKTLTEVEKELGITRPTLLKHINRAGIQVHFDNHDKRVKLLSEHDVSRLREVVRRMRKPTVQR